MKVSYSILAVIDGQQIITKGLTYDRFKALFAEIYRVGGFVVEYIEDEVI